MLKLNALKEEGCNVGHQEQIKQKALKKLRSAHMAGYTL